MPLVAICINSEVKRPSNFDFGLGNLVRITFTFDIGIFGYLQQQEETDESDFLKEDDLNFLK